MAPRLLFVHARQLSTGTAEPRWRLGGVVLHSLVASTMTLVLGSYSRTTAARAGNSSA